MSDLHVQVVEGRSREPSRIFSPGTPAGPMGVGSAGEWVVEGQGIGPIHAYLYFDGNLLLVATAPPHVTTVNGAPVGGDWSPVAVPSEVRLAGVRLSVQNSEVAFDDAATNMAPGEMDDVATAFIDRGSGAHVDLAGPIHKNPMPGGPMGGRRPPPADESTAFMPIEQVRKAPDARQSGPVPGGPGGPMPGGPMPGQPSVVVPETARQPVDRSKIALTIAPGQVPTPQIEPPPTPAVVAKPPEGGLKAVWSQASLARKVIYILLPIALLSSAFALLGEDDPKTKKKGPPKTAASASASAAPSSSVPMAAAIGSMPILPTGPMLPATPRPAASGKKPYPTTKAPPASLERKAVDAVIAGNYKEALALYEQLDQQYPNVPAYQEAIRILKAKQSAPKLAVRLRAPRGRGQAATAGGSRSRGRRRPPSQGGGPARPSPGHDLEPRRPRSTRWPGAWRSRRRPSARCPRWSRTA